MFEFERFLVYITAQNFFEKVQPIIRNKFINFTTRDQLYRASTSIMLNIAEGAGKFSKKDKKNFYTTARGSVQECASVLNVLKLEKKIDTTLYENLHNDLETMSKMLSGLIRKMLEKP